MITIGTLCHGLSLGDKLVVPVASSRVDGFCNRDRRQLGTV